MALPTTQQLTTSPTAISGLTIGVAYQVQLRKANSMLIEPATATPGFDSPTASYIGRNGWAVVQRDEASEEIYIWSATGAGHVVVNEVITNA